ncbi:lipid A deacylase LpxR family protein [Lacibacter sediminis]|uniref:Lipid A deacylase LpxR family protein n=1 Tax=Lacibacter sediminis TaxID=2760713 RepID=A0A7G5XK76_9BACT|nr:lipid A deacylase LpxR family protein [Lacibacter sediminis]QNA45879.1 lipid A deacylase LpxR family protein [Lacibacter sediminis]
MRHSVLNLLLLKVLMLACVCLYAQKGQKATLLRIYEDNDFLNIRGKGTDRAYSGGTRLDLFYRQNRKPFLFPAFLESKKDSTIFFGQWGLMQTIFTPDNISDADFQPNDYFYSGALFVIHSLYSFNPLRQYSFQLELQLGIRGPAAFGKQAQTFMHRLIGYTIPMGWDNQLPNMPVINASLFFEKQIASSSKYFELIAGVKLHMGTLRNGITVSHQFRWGLMNSYFSGYISQFSGSLFNKNQKGNKIQAYVVVKPELQFVFSNALLEDCFFGKTTTRQVDSRRLDMLTGINSHTPSDIRNMVYAINYGVVLSSGKCALSFVQNTSSEMRKGTYSHEVGNISLYFHL